MEPIVREAVVQRLERIEALDPIAQRVQDLVRRLIPQESQLKDAVSGTWLGHPVHPPLTDVVIGAWMSAGFLDLFGGDDSEQAADRLVGLGVVAAVPTAIAGLSDWSELFGGLRRVGSLHAIGNTTALGFQSMSWLARKRGRRSLGIGLSMVGAAVASGSAWLGGHLSFGRGVGVNQTAFESLPSEWTPVIEEDRLEEGKLQHASVDGVSIAIVKTGDRIHAMLDRCSHRGCSLHQGEFDGTTITCPCHGSTFRLDGTIVKGPATSPQPSFDVRVTSGRVEISPGRVD
jgi:nitrite reductase/ring-hydroxylating ferredoxin subunit